MLNDTQQLLEQTVFTFEKTLLMEDLEYQRYKEEYEQRYDVFKAKHKKNRELIYELNEILDAEASMWEYHTQFRLFLGLQMGMELRELRMLQFEWQMPRIPYSRAKSNI